MYTMALMAALTAAPDTAGFGWGSCTGCCGGTVVVGSGCCGGYASSCYGSSCTGSSCNGGGGLFGGGLFSRLRSRLGGGGCCSGSCYSTSCYSSCHGSCYSSSCYSSSCNGSYSWYPSYSSCHGYSFGGGCISSYPAYAGGCTGLSTGVSYGVSNYCCPPPVVSGCGCCGTTGGAVYYGPDFRSGGVVAPPIIGSSIVGSSAPAVPTLTIDNSTKEYRAAEAKPKATPARLTVELPASATLYVDGSEVKGEGKSRTFHTPDLSAGRTFYYDLKAEVTVDGKTVSEERRVLVKAGDSLTESFGKLIAADKGRAVAAK